MRSPGATAIIGDKQQSKKRELKIAVVNAGNECDKTGNNMKLVDKKKEAPLLFAQSVQNGT